VDRLLVDLLVVLFSAILSVVCVVLGWQGIAAKEIVLRGHHYKGIVAVFLSAIAYQVGLFVQGLTPFLLPR